MKLLWKLLRSNISKAQLAGFFLANLIGLFIIMISLQLYSDVKPLFTGRDNIISKDFLVLTKKAEIGIGNTFSSKEIAVLENQDFIKSVGVFQSSRFQVTAGIHFLNVGFSTEMFFESVPDTYIDVNLSEWQFHEDERIIPIILPRNYLNLYNYGFAQSRNLPRLSEEIIGLLQLDVELRGNRRSDSFKGRIIGFSNRLNTILVPEQFMKWANQRYAPGKENLPSRIIVETERISDNKLMAYFHEKGYEAEGGRLDNSRASWFLTIIAGGVLFIGLLITLLAIYILILSVYLLLEKNNTKLENLYLIGYSVKKISRPYQYLALGMVGGVVLISIALVLWIRTIYLELIQELWPGLESGSLWPMLSVVFLLFVVISILNTLFIQMKVGKLVKK